MAKIVTGYTGSEHITSDDWASLNAGLVSAGDAILTFNMPDAVETSSGVITLPKMELMIQGVHCRTDGTEKVTVATGSQGLYRNDLIVGRYKKASSSGVESFEIDIVKGTASSSPEDPTLTQNDIRAGGTVREAALFRVRLYGSTIQSIEPVISVVKNMFNIQGTASSALSLAKNANAYAKNVDNRSETLEKRTSSLEKKLDFAGTIRSLSQYAKAAIQSWVSSYDSTTTKPENLGASMSLQDSSGNEKASIRIYSNGRIIYTLDDEAYEVPIFQRGSQSMSVTKANTSVKKTVSFPKSYKSAPNVFLSISTSNPLNCAASFSNVTAKGFTLHFNATAAMSANIEWCSIGRLDV
jgi:hypothetical protein